MIAQSAGGSLFLQYGALGLCALMFITFVTSAKWAVAKLLRTIDMNTRAMTRISQALEHRPCLHKDRIFDDE